MIEDEPREARTFRTIAFAAGAVLALDLILIVVTGGSSILTPGMEPTPLAFAAREALLALALLVGFRFLARPGLQASAGQVMLMLAVFPALFHLHFLGRRITGDGLYYYVYTRSLIRDADLNFENEYAHYELLNRGDLAVPTVTGHRRSNYPIGPGLLWTPFFLAADGLGFVLGAGGLDVNTSGYGPFHLNAVALGSFSYGVLALFLIHALLRRRFGDLFAAGTTLLLWWASFFPWYLAEQPLSSHPASVLLVAAFFLLREHGALASGPGSLALGLALGAGMSVRWQNGVYLLLPAVDLLVSWRAGWPLGRLAKRALLLGLGVFAGALPQLLAWKAIYGAYLLPYPPQGTDYVRLDHPYLLNVLFSSRHGLLSWTPVFWLSLAGLVFLTRTNPRRFGILWAPVIIVTYVNASSGDWWAGGSFSNRRFDSLLPVFALGLAAFLHTARRFVERHPSSVLAALVLGGAAWNITLVRAVQRGEAPAGAPMSLAARAQASARALSLDVGFPTTWPASWIFAGRYHASPGAFDLAAGKYLFYRQNNLEGLADLGSEGDEALFLDGFFEPREDGPVTYRGFGPEARMIVSLDLPEALDLAFRARSQTGAPSRVEVQVNGHEAGTLELESDWTEVHLQTPRQFWRTDANIITLRSATRNDLDRVNFLRVAP